MLAREKQMTPEQIALVQASFAKVAPIADQVAILFYDRLFELAPQVRRMFPADITEQRRKLMATLAFVGERVSEPSIGVAGGKRAGRTPCRIWRQARALPRRWRCAAVDSGEGAGRCLDG